LDLSLSSGFICMSSRYIRPRKVETRERREEFRLADGSDENRVERFFHREAFATLRAEQIRLDPRADFYDT